MLFQKLEGLLKYITVHNKIAADLSQFSAKHKGMMKSAQDKTMGQLVTEHLNPNTEKSTCEPDVLIEPFMSFEIELPPAYYEEKDEKLRAIVAERNDLVHHSYLNYDLQSTVSRKEFDILLDEQQKRIQTEIEGLRKIAESINRFKSALHEYLISGKFKQDFQSSWLRNSELVLLLHDISIKIARQDGWASLSTAGKFIREAAPDEMAVLKQKYGYKSLKPLILESGIFDLYEEPTKKNGKVVLFRIKPNLELSAV